MNGLRISEALGADIDNLDVNRGHRTLFIHRKGNKTATIPLSPRTARALDLYIGERESGPIFLNHDGTSRLDRHASARIVRRLTKAAGIDKRISPHSLRHSFITAALDAGVPLRDVQEAASHSDPRNDNALRPRTRIARPARHLHRVDLRRRSQPLTEAGAIAGDNMIAHDRDPLPIHRALSAAGYVRLDSVPRREISGGRGPKRV